MRSLDADARQSLVTEKTMCHTQSLCASGTCVSCTRQSLCSLLMHGGRNDADGHACLVLHLSRAH